MSSEIPKKIQGPEKLDPNQPVKGFKNEDEPSKSFDTYMNEPQQAGKQEQLNPNAQQQISPAELAQQQPKTSGPPTMQSVLSQMQTTSSSLGDLQNKLNTPNLKLKSSQKYLLRNKLTEANSQIRNAASKAGVDVGAPPENFNRQNPITRFLSLVTDGQRQINETQKKVAEISASGKSMKPGDLLLVQLKISKAQQELEYSSIVLNNAISDVKMLFNVQL